MRKKGKKWKEAVPYEEVMAAIDKGTAERLYKTARIVCPADEAVRSFKDGDSPSGLRRSLRKALERGAFDHRAVVIRELEL